MNAKELNYILQEGESYLVEFKERANKSLARELTAFLPLSLRGIAAGYLTYLKKIVWEKVR